MWRSWSRVGADVMAMRNTGTKKILTLGSQNFFCVTVEILAVWEFTDSAE